MKLPKFEQWWAESDEGKRTIAEGEAAEVGERQAHVEKIAELRKALAKDVVPALKAVEKERAAFEKAREALTAAEMKLRAAQLDEHNLRTRAESEIGQLDQQLRDNAIPGLASFLSHLAGLWDEERQDWPWSHRDQPGSAGERIAQIRRVTEQVEQLYLEPDPEVAEATLASLKAELDTRQAAVAAA